MPIFYIKINILLPHFKTKTDFPFESKFYSIGYQICNNLHNSVLIFIDYQAGVFII